MNNPTEFAFIHLRGLYSMELQVASSLPVLAGSVMNNRLRKLLWQRCLHARDRRDQLALLLDRNHEGSGEVECVVTRGILSGGNKILAKVGNPFARDFMMVGHCLRLENHELTAYGTAARMAERAGYAAEALLLVALQSDLKFARPRLQSLEYELSTTPTHDFELVRLKETRWELQSAEIAMELEPVHAA